ncbi:MAG TPA: uroporphyrinogen decarboxylase family protein [Phycisphaerae bacterium]|nr:uroporphyrinogen decarboxylase family protein [Phycisphaerae bacterium]
MTSCERFRRMFEHRQADRVPIQDSPWNATLERWRREGMPEGVDWRDYFGVDKVADIGVDNSFRFERRVLEETDEYLVEANQWGATVKNWKHVASTPLDLDFAIKDRGAWEKAKKRLTPTSDRIDWNYLKTHYSLWRKEGRWIEAGLWFGFDITHSRIVGTERLLYAMVDDPEWCVDMFNTFLDLDLALLDQVWEAGYTWDAVTWPDDMGFKGKQFFSPAMYRSLLKPVHKRAIEWIHSKGGYAHLHSCGNIMPFVPDLLEIGVDCLNPMEVKAGMDPLALKRDCGDRLVLHGGVNAVLWDDRDAIVAEIERLVPALKASGGYIFASDHSIPSSVSLENFRAILDAVKRAGAYG